MYVCVCVCVSLCVYVCVCACACMQVFRHCTNVSPLGRLYMYRSRYGAGNWRLSLPVSCTNGNGLK